MPLMLMPLFPKYLFFKKGYHMVFFKETVDKLRICDVCKNFLDRREEAMDLRTAHSVFVDVYQKLCTLLTQISNLAPSYRHMAESLKCVFV